MKGNAIDLLHLKLEAGRLTSLCLCEREIMGNQTNIVVRGKEIQ